MLARTSKLSSIHLAAGLPQRLAQAVVAGEAPAERATQASGRSTASTMPVTPSAHGLGRPRGRRGDDGHPGRHRLGDHVRKAVAVAARGHHPRVQEHVGPFEVLPHLLRGHLPDEGDQVGDAQAARQALELRPERAVAHNPGREFHAGRPEGRVDPQLPVEPLLLDQPGEREQVQRDARGVKRLQGGKPLEAAADADDPVRRESPRPMSSWRASSVEVCTNTAASSFSLSHQSPPCSKTS